MADEYVTVRVDLTDALQLPSGNQFPSPSGPLIIFVKAPRTWLIKGELTPKAKAAVLAKLYGASWELGNEDGSRYVVKIFTSRELAAKESNELSVKSAKNTWVYEVSKAGTLEKHKP